MVSQAKSFFKMTNAEVERYFGDLWEDIDMN
jgi:hypothetical protein